MDEKIKVRFTVPETLAESANRFLKSLAYPTQKPDGELSPPTPISVERESGVVLGDYMVESLKLRPTGGIDAGGFPRATFVEVVAIPIKAGGGKVEADDVFICPECNAEHSRGPLDPLSRIYRCLKCGYVGLKVEDVEWISCLECKGTGLVGAFDKPMLENLCSSCCGKGQVRKDELGPMGFRGEVEKGPVDTAVTVENEEEFKGEFGDGKTFPSDEGKQKLKRRILDRMTAVDMVDAISNGCDLPNLADIIIDLFPEEEILEMTPKERLCPECGATGKVYPNPGSVAFENCSRCSGTGKVIVEDEEDVLEEVTHHDLVIVEDLPRDDCPECLGNGKKFYGEPDETDCPRCNGTGKV